MLLTVGGMPKLFRLDNSGSGVPGKPKAMPEDAYHMPAVRRHHRSLGW